MSKAGIKAFAPASITNLTVGYGILGCAIENAGVEILIREGVQPGIHLTEITGATGKIPKETSLNTAGLAAMKLLEDTDMATKALEMQIHVKMPVNAGTGCAAACASGAVFAVSEFLKLGIPRQTLLDYALESVKELTGHQQLSHVIPSMLGGMILCNEHTEPCYKKLHTPPGIYLVLISPISDVPKSDFGNIVQNKLSYEHVCSQQASLGSFIAAMYTTDLPLLSSCMKDSLVDTHLASLFPDYVEIKKIAEAEQAPGFGLTGRGPAMFALCDNSLKAENISRKAEEYFTRNKRKVKCIVSKINHQGVVLF